MPAKMPEILGIALKYEIPVLEDAAEALGSSINGRLCGSFGEMACLSFNGNKIITTSGGGALLSKSATVKDKAIFLATQARDPAPHYEHTQIGYNYRMSNISAGIGRGQMEVLDQHIGLRKRNFEYYKDALSTGIGLHFLEEPDGFVCNRWLSCIYVDDLSSISREQIRLALETENIESRPLWKPMHLQPVFRDAPYYGAKVSEKLFNNGLCLPSGSNLTVADLDRVTSVIRSLSNNGN